MLDTTLPLHTLTGLRAVGWRRPRFGEDGPQPIWPIRGGDGTDDDGQDDGDQGDNDETDDDQDDDRDGDDQDDEKDLGDAGKKALRELRKENRQLKSQLRTARQDGGRQDDTKKDDDKDPEALRAQAREEARAEVWTERVEAAAIASAAGRLANPQLAARLLDLSDIPTNDKGRPDRDAINELIDELLEDEPYLAARSEKDGGGRRFAGGADGGARKPPTKRAASLGEAVAARLAAQSGR
ncbi:hypothetical protein ACFWOG_04390 [Kitasatospora sp. NPDC058406]|uniref:hypothetical protein n=1 Tax=Kitasatospora sp. NPDC058406 TaxID=3346483 RepID=UPI0036598564